MTKRSRLALYITLSFVLLAANASIAEARVHQHHENYHKIHHVSHHHEKKGHHHQHYSDFEKQRGHIHHKKLEERVYFHDFQDKVESSDQVNHIVRQSPKVPVEMQARAGRNRRNEDALLTSSSVITTTITPESTTKSAIEMLLCKSTSDCKNITNSNCDAVKNTCVCDGELSVLIKTPPGCYKAAALNATCSYDDQCLSAEEFSKCDVVKKICVCIPGYEMKEYPDVGVNCVTKSGKSGGVNVDPAMIGVLAGLALMFIIICVVLRLFSKARFRENRSIFNTPNPRLMNASLFKDSKLLSPARGDRRGSRASVRGPPSRAQSITSVNKDSAGRSPNGSLAKGRRGSALSTASATGSAAAGVPASSKSPGGSPEEKPKETTVAVETVD